MRSGEAVEPAARRDARLRARQGREHFRGNKGGTNIHRSGPHHKEAYDKLARGAVIEDVSLGILAMLISPIVNYFVSEKLISIA